MIRKLKGEDGSAEDRAWSRWLGTAAKMRQDWCLTAPRDDPFAYNETASLSFLACAAGRAGMVALAEYCAPKQRTTRGRCDFWLSDDETEWVIEFKQAILGRTAEPTMGWAERQWDAALGCAAELLPEKGVRTAAGLIISTYYVDGRRRARFRRDICAFLDERAAFAWEMESPTGSSPSIFVAFGLVS
jgi:hypothetical protein